MNPAAKWACASALSCATSFVLVALPWLQAAALIVTIAAGLRSLAHKKP